MELQVIREYLDTLDRALRYILVQRMSIIPLVAETKIEQGMPFYQPEREDKMYASMKTFSQETGLNPELLKQIYKIIIKDAIRIEHEIEDSFERSEGTSYNQLDNDAEEDYSGLLENANKSLKEFLTVMEDVRAHLGEKGLVGEDVTKFITQYYKKNVK